MIKQLLSVAAMAAFAVGAQADTLDLSLSDLGSGWESSYDAATKTITFEGAWKGRGWWIGDEDYSKWDVAVVKFEPVEATVQLVIEYTDDINVASTSVSVGAGADQLTAELDPDGKAHVKQIYIQMSQAGTLTLTAAYLENGIEVDPNLLWEGEYKISGWNSGAEFSASKVKAGDILEYTFTEAGSSSAQVLVKNASWENLLGTEKIGASDIATGSVQVGVTQEMLDNCGGKIFVQGDGECVLTKVAKVGTFDPEGVLAYGERILGASVYVTIPENTKELALEFDAVPSWMQICNTSWTDMELEYVASEDGKTRTYTLTEEAITTINEKKEFVINGGGANVLKVYIPSSTSAVKAVEAVDANAGVDVYSVSGVKVKSGVSAAEAAQNLPRGLYIIGGKKVIVR